MKKNYPGNFFLNSVVKKGNNLGDGVEFAKKKC